MLDQITVTRQLDNLRARYPQNNPDLVAEIVRNILSTMRGDLTAGEAALLNEVEDLARTVASARAEIAALQALTTSPQAIFPSATDELDAIVAHTATATDSILECCEQIDVVSSRLEGEDFDRYSRKWLPVSTKRAAFRTSLANASPRSSRPSRRSKPRWRRSSACSVRTKQGRQSRRHPPRRPSRRTHS